MVFQHISEYLNMVNTDDSAPVVGRKILHFMNDILFWLILGLGYFSEQAFEAMHHDLKVSSLMQNGLSKLHARLFLRFCLDIISLKSNLTVIDFTTYIFSLTVFFPKVLWERVKVSIGHPEFADRLRAFIVAYNAKHL